MRPWRGGSEDRAFIGGAALKKLGQKRPVENIARADGIDRVHPEGRNMEVCTVLKAHRAAFPKGENDDPRSLGVDLLQLLLKVQEAFLLRAGEQGVEDELRTDENVDIPDVLAQFGGIVVRVDKGLDAVLPGDPKAFLHGFIDAGEEEPSGAP